MAHSYLEYLRLKAIISALRFFDGEKPVEPSPDDSFTFTSTDGQRELKVNVYRSKITKTQPSPVVLNWNGGAFVFSAQGSDERFCRHLVDQTAYTVLDASYALAPEHPFPSALEDAEELVLQVFKRPAEYDTQNIVLSGFSSGGNIALAASSNLKKRNSDILNKSIRGVAVFYPPTNMTIPPTEKRTIDGSLPPVPSVLRVLMNAFRSSYLPPGVDPSDPRNSVLFADPNTFPKNVLIITAEKDRLAPEAEEFAGRLQKAGKNVLLKRFDGVAHGWDKTKDEDSNETRVRDEAYDLVVKFISGLN
ncbi:esterase lipase [Colletotrichum truncatum]|uniref:Esterase lipase n=1 Tax=Colletotrichum truncatum TaxID=5467 RepID=A0ACC3Z1J5_COLTU|nr:esterase lipase [Colletotrichum truncatum]KAF6788871.1 esterase lipase [Colletotrichum truncatum]